MSPAPLANQAGKPSQGVPASFHAGVRLEKTLQIETLMAGEARVIILDTAFWRDYTVLRLSRLRSPSKILKLFTSSGDITRILLQHWRTLSL
ncbi:hypothetical protein ANRL2_02561 [Anaerolineae bacterium]|nr:hypothetical protein ANRL2_02561 [Anaerolineae bacterium]